MHYRGSDAERRGTILILIALILFVLFALAALVIDMGFARVTHREMQTAVDSAALEKLRGFDPGDFQPNVDNDPAGDIVRGQYLGDLDHTEQANYQREDFIPSPDQQSAFLVRMRRSNETFSPGNGQSSVGPPLPFLFGRGSLLPVEVKDRGITVRATAIADARPAMSVGVPLQDPLTPGVTSFALNQTFWNLFQQSASLRAENGEVISGTIHAGQLLTPQPLSIGEIPFLDPQVSSGDRSQGNYVPIIADAGPIEGRIIGFSYIDILSQEDNAWQITRHPSQMAAMNASAVMVHPLDAEAAREIDALLQANQSLAQPLLAPALVR